MKSFLSFSTALTVFALVFLLALPSPASGQAVSDTPAFDSLGKASDSLKAGKAKPVADTTGSGDLRSPRTAMLLSLLIPGAGQFYNESYWKGGVIAAAEIALASLTVREHLLLTNISNTMPSSIPDSVRQDLITSYRDRRNAFAFLTGVVIIYSLSDAYVDSHMFHFREQQTLLSLGPAERGLGIAVILNF